jgi:hypothetical protein
MLIRLAAVGLNCVKREFDINLKKLSLSKARHRVSRCRHGKGISETSEPRIYAALDP